MPPTQAAPTPGAKEQGNCVRCKAQGKGPIHCRGKHDVEAFPATGLSQALCKTYLQFKSNDPIDPEEQQSLEDALASGGQRAASEALNKLMDVPSDPTAVGATTVNLVVSDDDDDGEDDISTTLNEGGGDSTWRLTPFPGDEQDGDQTRRPTSNIADRMLAQDEDLSGRLLAATIKPFHLKGKGSTPSSASEAVNPFDGLCPNIRDWLTGSRDGTWECDTPKTCGGTHQCNSKAGCDADPCHLMHSTCHCHWVVFRGGGYDWVKALSLDQALRIKEPGGVMVGLIRDKKAKTEFTRADVWRACPPVIAYGRLIPLEAEPTKPEGTPAEAQPEPKKPEGTPAETQPEVPSAEAKPEGPPTKTQPASDQSSGALPHAGKAGTGVSAAAADSKRDPDSGAKRQRDGEDESGDRDDVTGKGGSDKGEGNGGLDKGKGGSGKGYRYALPGEKVETTCLRIAKYVADPESETGAFSSSVLAAEALEPTERASLMVRLAGMIQGDQRKARRLLRQSVELSAHFANQVEHQQ